MNSRAQQQFAPLISSARLRGLCRVVRGLTALGAAVLVGISLWNASSSDALRSQWQSMSYCGNDLLTIDDRARWLGNLAMLPGTLVGLFALWQLWRLFGEYAGGRVFSRVAQRHLRGFALGVLVAALAAPVERVLLGLALTIGNPPGQRMLTLNVSSDDYVSLLIGAVLLAIAAVMGEAVRLAEDHAGFV